MEVDGAVWVAMDERSAPDVLPPEAGSEAVRRTLPRRTRRSTVFTLALASAGQGVKTSVTLARGAVW